MGYSVCAEVVFFWFFFGGGNSVLINGQKGQEYQCVPYVLF